MDYHARLMARLQKPSLPATELLEALIENYVTTSQQAHRVSDPAYLQQLDDYMRGYFREQIERLGGDLSQPNLEDLRRIQKVVDSHLKQQSIAEAVLREHTGRVNALFDLATTVGTGVSRAPTRHGKTSILPAPEFPPEPEEATDPRAQPRPSTESPAPLRPVNLAMAFERKGVWLRWDAVPEANGYHVYTRLMSTRSYHRVNTDTLTVAEFEWHGAAAGDYAVIVSVIDEFGDEVDFSHVLTVSIAR